MSRQKPTLYDAFSYVPGRTSSQTSLTGRPRAQGVFAGGFGPFLLIVAFSLGVGFLGGYHFDRPSPGATSLDARVSKPRVVRIQTYGPKPVARSDDPQSQADEAKWWQRVYADRDFVQRHGGEFKLICETSANGETHWALVKPGLNTSADALVGDVRTWTDDKGQVRFPDAMVVAAP